jgi:hypothetical protein
MYRLWEGAGEGAAGSMIIYGWSPHLWATVVAASLLARRSARQTATRA